MERLIAAFISVLFGLAFSKSVEGFYELWQAGKLDWKIGFLFWGFCLNYLNAYLSLLRTSENDTARKIYEQGPMNAFAMFLGCIIWFFYAWIAMSFEHFNPADFPTNLWLFLCLSTIITGLYMIWDGISFEKATRHRIKPWRRLDFITVVMVVLSAAIVRFCNRFSTTRYLVFIFIGGYILTAVIFFYITKKAARYLLIEDEDIYKQATQRWWVLDFITFVVFISLVVLSYAFVGVRSWLSTTIIYIPFIGFIYFIPILDFWKNREFFFRLKKRRDRN